MRGNNPSRTGSTPVATPGAAVPCSIDAGADKKAIKAAYFELVNDFHPDRYFGKNLGSFKPKPCKVLRPHGCLRSTITS